MSKDFCKKCLAIGRSYASKATLQRLTIELQHVTTLR